jgi:hypothetical protein
MFLFEFEKELVAVSDRAFTLELLLIFPLNVLKKISVLDDFDLNRQQNSAKFKSSFGLISFLPKG